MTFNGFISYSHAADGRLAPAVQRGLHRLAKPWHRRRALWIFRDQTGLAVTPGLWSSIENALDDSDYFVLLASPEAARSKWVNREVEHWVSTKSTDRILPVVTDGVWRWDPERGDFAEDSTAVPAALRGVFAEEPLFLDLRWARDDRHLSLRHSRFRDAIAQLAAPMHGLSKDDLEGEDVRQHRRVRRLQSAAVATLVLLTVVASLTGMLAVRNAGRANAAAAEAQHQQRVAAEQQGNAERSAGEARRQQELAKQQQERAKEATAQTRRQQQLAREQKSLAEQAAVEAGRQEQLAREQKRLARQASADAGRQQQNAKRQRELADRAGTRAQAQQQLAQQQRELAMRWAEQARQQEQAAKAQQERAQQATEEASRQLAKAEQEQRTAIRQRLINQAKATMNDDPETGLMLGAAAQKVEPDAETRQQISGLVTSTHYVGTLSNARIAAYGPDGALITVSGDRAVSVWDMTHRTSPVRLRTFETELTLVSSVAVSPDGRTLAVADRDRPASLWDIADRTHPVRIAELADKATSVVYSPDRRTLATGNSGTMTLWDVTERTKPKRLFTLSGDGALDNNVGFSRDGKILALARQMSTTILDLTDRAHPVKLTTLDHPHERPTSMAFNVTGKPLLATANSSGAVQLWDMSTPSQPSRLSTLSASGGVNSTAFGSDGRTLAVGDGQGTTTLWDITDDPVRLQTLTGHSPVESISFSPDGKTVVTVENGDYSALAKATLWTTTDYGTPEHLADLTDTKTSPLTIAYSPNGRRLATAYPDGTAVFWDVSDPTDPVRLGTLSDNGSNVDSMGLGPDGRILAAGRDGQVILSDVTVPSHPVTLATFDQDVQESCPMWFSPDGRTLAITAKDGSLALWDLTNRSRPARLSRLTGDYGAFVLPVAFSPDGRTMAARDGTQSVTLWDLTDRSAPVQLGALTYPNAGVLMVAFSPDGRTVATGTTNHATILWDVTDPTHPHQIATLAGHGWAGWLGFSPDGSLFSYGDASGTRLWDITDRAKPVPLATLDHAGVTAIAVFSPDGHTIAAFSWYGSLTSVALLDYTKLNDARADPAKQACAITGRGLSPDEWTRYIPELPYQPTCEG